MTVRTQVCTHTPPPHWQLEAPALPPHGGGTGMQDSRQLQGASPSPCLPFRLAEASSCSVTGARAEHTRGSSRCSTGCGRPSPPSVTPQNPPKTRLRGFPRPPAPLAHHGRDCPTYSCNSHSGKRTGPQNTLRGWEKARSRKPSPRPRRLSATQSRKATSSSSAAAAAAAASTAPQCPARARLGRSREAARTLAGRKDLATCASDAARAILTEGSRPLFPFLLCEGRLSSETPRWEDRDGKEGRLGERRMGPGMLESADQRPPPRARDPPGRSQSLAGGGPGPPDGGTLTTRRLALRGLAVAAAVAGLRALVLHHRGHGRRCGLEGRPRLSEPGPDLGRARDPRREGRECGGGCRVRASPPAPRTGPLDASLGCKPRVCAPRLPCSINNPQHFRELSARSRDMETEVPEWGSPRSRSAGLGWKVTRLQPTTPPDHPKRKSWSFFFFQTSCLKCYR